MRLDSSATLVMVAVLAMVLAVIAVWALRKRRGLWGSILTVFLLLLLPFTGALTIGTAMNTHRHYAPTWHALASLMGIAKSEDTGQIPTGQPSYEDEETAAASTQQALTRPEGAEWKISFQKDPANGALKTVFRGPHSGIEMPVWVWVPRDYNPAKEYKVVMLLEGYPSDTEQILRYLDLDNEMGASGANTIVALPKLGVDNESPDCVDIEGRPAVGTWVTRDVVGMLRANFNTSSQREDWAIAGASYGGWCAPVLGLTHPELFGSVISLSGYNRPLTGRLQTNPQAAKDFSVLELMKNATWPQRFYLTATGNDGDAVALLNGAQQIGNPDLPVDIYRDATGSHNWRTWHDHFPRAMSWWRGEPQPADPEGVTVPRSRPIFTSPVTPAVLGIMTLGAAISAACLGERWRRRFLLRSGAVLGIAIVGILALLFTVNLFFGTVSDARSIGAFFALFHG